MSDPAAKPCATASGCRAAVFTVDPRLADRLARLHSGVRTAVLTRLPGTAEGILRDHDALLVLASQPAAAGTGGHASTIYVSTDPDDTHAAERASALRAGELVVFSDPAGRIRLWTLLHEHLDGAA